MGASRFHTPTPTLRAFPRNTIVLSSPAIPNSGLSTNRNSTGLGASNQGEEPFEAVVALTATPRPGHRFPACPRRAPAASRLTTHQPRSAALAAAAASTPSLGGA